MNSSRKIVKTVGKNLGIVVVGWVVLLCIMAAIAGPRNIGRLIGVAYLLRVRYPSTFPFRETYRAVVCTPPNSWVEFEHTAHGQDVGRVVRTLIDVMESAGFAKRDAQEIAGTEGAPRYWLLFAPENGHFCYEVTVTKVRDRPTTVVLVKSVYKMFSERAYMRFKWASERLKEQGL